MASITKTKNGSYRVKIRKKDFPAISKNFTRKSHAQRWATETEAEMDKGIYITDNKADTLLISQLCTLYLKNEVPRMKSAYHYIGYTKLINEHFGHLTISELNTKHIKAYRDQALLYIKADTVRKQLGVLRAMINYAIKELDIFLATGNPVERVSLPLAYPL